MQEQLRSERLSEFEQLLRGKHRSPELAGAAAVAWLALYGGQILVDLRDGHQAQNSVAALERQIEDLKAPVPMLLWCPDCGERHIDKGAFATKPHHTHACQHCGHCWRPAVVPTVGVQYLPGFKDP